MPAKRTIVCFFLVDPTLRIRSTATIPPQQMSWYGDQIKPLLEKAGITEEAIQNKVLGYYSAMPDPEVLTYDQACERRNRLMDERGQLQEEYGWTFHRPFNLCEH